MKYLKELTDLQYSHTWATWNVASVIFPPVFTQLKSYLLIKCSALNIRKGWVELLMWEIKTWCVTVDMMDCGAAVAQVLSSVRSRINPHIQATLNLPSRTQQVLRWQFSPLKPAFYLPILFNPGYVTTRFAALSASILINCRAGRCLHQIWLNASIAVPSDGLMIDFMLFLWSASDLCGAQCAASGVFNVLMLSEKYEVKEWRAPSGCM